jgi:O-acetyl-ADP-ribose deacetylase (regulator of RNase III)
MKEIDGDLVKMFDDGEFDVIIHGCNCFHAMGAGIAGQIAIRYPEALEYDRYYSEKGDFKKLSDYTFAIVNNSKMKGTVINLYTQYNPGPDLKITALDLGFYKLSHTLSHKVRIGIPKIGAGLAGGDWDVIEPIIANHMQFHNVTVVNYKKTKK